MTGFNDVTGFFVGAFKKEEEQPVISYSLFC